MLRAGRFGVRIPVCVGDFFLFSKSPEVALGPISPPVRLVSEFLSGIMRSERESLPLPSTSQVKNKWNCTCNPSVCFCGFDGDIFTRWFKYDRD